MSQFNFRDLGAGLTLTLINRRRVDFHLTGSSGKPVVYINQFPFICDSEDERSDWWLAKNWRVAVLEAF